MLLLYRLSIWLYQLLIAIVAPFNSKAKFFKEGRKGIFAKIENAMKSNTSKVIWVHAASLGEFEQARPVIEKLKILKPDYKVFLTFFSPSGFEIRKNYTGADWIFYLPLDSPSNAKKFVDLVKPEMALFTKYEFWFNYLKVLKDRGVKVYSFSAIFRESQVFFKSYGGFYRNFLKYIDYFFVQDENSKKLLKSIGFENVQVAGDTRFDRVAEICAQKKDIPLAAAFKQNSKVMVIGSSWPQDIEVLLPLINNQDIKLKYIIAPHEIHDAEIEDLRNKIHKKSVRFSNPYELSEAEVLFIDNIGMLSSLYQYGDLAYVGGAFGKGLHNILEPATFGMPVFFGPKYTKFMEAVNLIQHKSAFSIINSNELMIKVKELVENEEDLISVSKLSFDFVQNNTGATKIIINYILN